MNPVQPSLSRGKNVISGENTYLLVSSTLNNIIQVTATVGVILLVKWSCVSLWWWVQMKLSFLVAAGNVEPASWYDFRSWKIYTVEYSARDESKVYTYKHCLIKDVVVTEKTFLMICLPSRHVSSCTLSSGHCIINEHTFIYFFLLFSTSKKNQEQRFRTSE